MYHGIILCGSRDDRGGRNIAGYRLRTAAEKFGYNILVIDCATAMTEEELESILDNVVTDQTLILGISTIWIERPEIGKDSIGWINKDFFDRFKSKYQKTKLVAGGSAVLRMPGAMEIYKSADWHITGFSDDSFPRFLMMLEGKSGHGLKYFVDSNGKKSVDSDRYHMVVNTDDIETVLKQDDGFESYQPIPIEVSRGCIFRCAFCSHPFQGAKDYDSYMRTPHSLSREFRRNYELFGTTRYSIMDDTFNDSVEKLNRLEQAIELANLPKFEFQCFVKPELLVTKPEMVSQLLRMGLVGGFVGIESLNDHARKSMNKGMGIDRVLQSLDDLTTSGQVKLHSGFIIGLPGDSIESIHKTFEFCMKSTLLRSWTMTGLGIYSYSEIEKTSQSVSTLEKNPEKYGYTLSHKPGSYAYWKNEFMDSPQASALAKSLNAKSLDVMRCGGWAVSTAWQCNENDYNIETKLLKDLDLDNRGRQEVRNRAIETIKRYT